MNAPTRIGVACVGAGDWGQNQIRVFAALPSANLRYIVDVSPQTVGAMRSRYPDTTVTSDLKQVLADSAVRWLLSPGTAGRPSSATTSGSHGPPSSRT